MEDVFEDLDDLHCQKSFPNSKKSIFGGRVRESGRFWARKISKNNPKIVKIHFWKTCSRILQKTGKLDSGSRVYVFFVRTCSRIWMTFGRPQIQKWSKNSFLEDVFEEMEEFGRKK